LSERNEDAFTRGLHFRRFSKSLSFLIEFLSGSTLFVQLLTDFSFFFRFRSIKRSISRRKNGSQEPCDGQARICHKNGKSIFVTFFFDFPNFEIPFSDKTRRPESQGTVPDRLDSVNIRRKQGNRARDRTRIENRVSESCTCSGTLGETGRPTPRTKPVDAIRGASHDDDPVNVIV